MKNSEDLIVDNGESIDKCNRKAIQFFFVRLNAFESETPRLTIQPVIYNIVI